jgi:chemotaxis protein MotB
VLKGFGEVGPSADEAVRDPFHPLGSDKATNVMAPDPGARPEPNAASEDDSSAPPTASGPTNPGPRQGGDGAEPIAGRDTAASAVAKSAPSSPVEAKPPAHEANFPADGAKSAADGAKPPAGQTAPTTEARAASLLAEIKKRLGALAQPASGPQLDVKATEEGILVSLTDRQNFSMFAIGSAEPQPRVVGVMDAIAMSLESLPGTIVVRGHTDGRLYRSATYDNWRLSSARAQMAYYMLARGGVAEKRFDRIEGFADHRLRDPAHPLAPENRRIEILLREASP